jgi:glycosyltransferase involved in cell wall biosynthesis
VKVGVYNRFWATGGGGERYGLAIAAGLAQQHAVDLLGPDDFDRDWLAERLHIGLEVLGHRTVADTAGAVTRASRAYDLFVNVSHDSTDENGAPRGIYVVHFPGRTVTPSGGWHRGPVRVIPGAGFHPTEPGRHALTWTAGDASLLVAAPADAAVSLDLAFARARPASLGATTVRVHVDDSVVEHTIPPRRALGVTRGSRLRITVTGRADGEPVVVRIVSDTFRPDEVTGSGDTRVLGVALATVRIGRTAGTATLDPPAARGAPFLRTYDAVVTNSEFTRHWVERRWGVIGEVLHPPARQVVPAGREPIILNIGRFFPPELGHGKRQLELVEAFRRLLATGHAGGWTLHLVGGCKPGEAAYLDGVVAAAKGLPVELHVDAGGDDLDALLARASVYWHATGLGDDIDAQPERFEHFGIAVAEAMAAGAVPVVLDAAGPKEIVRPDVDGFTFEDLDGLVHHTDRLVTDEGLRTAMSAAAMLRGAEFSDEQFAGRVLALVDRVAGAAATR